MKKKDLLKKIRYQKLLIKDQRRLIRLQKECIEKHDRPQR